MEGYLGYDSRMAICAIVVLPVLFWWLSIKTNRRVKWFGYFLILFFIRGSIELTGLVNNTLLRYMFELPIVFLYISSYKKYSYAGRSLIFPFIMASTISAIETNWMMLVLFLLFFLEIFMLLIYFRNKYNSDEALVLNKLLWYLACSQIFTALIKYFMVGVMEPYIGSMSSHEGGITTVFSLVMYCYSLEKYFCTKKRIYLWALSGFVLFGLVGMKRALAFFFPVFYFVVLLLHSHFTHSISKNLKKLIYGMMFMPILFVVVCILNPSFNPEEKVGGSFDLDYVLDYTERYNRGDMGGDDDIGRAEAMGVVHAKMLDDNWRYQLFGYGAGSALASSFNSLKVDDDSKAERYGAGYSLGIGYLLLLVQVGFVGVFFYFLIFICLFVNLFNKIMVYSKYMTQIEIGNCVIALLTILCILVFSFSYNYTSLVFNCASLLNMWFIAYAYITIDEVKQRIV